MSSQSKQQQQQQQQQQGIPSHISIPHHGGAFGENTSHADACSFASDAIGHGEVAEELEVFASVSDVSEKREWGGCGVRVGIGGVRQLHHHVDVLAHVALERQGSEGEGVGVWEMEC